jgi:hypothetical protein
MALAETEQAVSYKEKRRILQFVERIGEEQLKIFVVKNTILSYTWPRNGDRLWKRKRLIIPSHKRDNLSVSEQT